MRRLVAYLLRVIACVVVITATARTSSHYFYCEAMGVMQQDPCRTSAHPASLPEASAPLADCCRMITVAPVPRGLTASSPAIAPAAFIVLAALPMRAHEGVVPPRARWLRGPAPPRLASDRRAELMVFLT